MTLSKRQKSQLFSFILLVVFGLLALFKNQGGKTAYNDVNTGTNKKLIYTKHAECRMDCRFISEEEVNFIRKSGNINYRKSDMEDKPCPTISKEGRTKDGQMVRIVFAECDNSTKVVTAIDLEENHKCNCK